MPFLGSALVRLGADGQPVLSCSWMLLSGVAYTPVDALVTSDAGLFFGTGSHFAGGLLQPADATLFGFDATLDFGACREVAVLVEQRLPAVRHEAAFEASTLPSGVYVYRLEAGGRVLARTMLLVK